MNRLKVWLFTGVVFAFVVASNPAPGQEKQPLKPMEKMSMDDMMKDCMQNHQAAMKSIDQMSKMMEGAKQSNDSGKMRSALDQAQKQLAEMKEHMSKCDKM